jgi:poly-gamma-glutamate system protein
MVFSTRSRLALVCAALVMAGAGAVLKAPRASGSIERMRARAAEQHQATQVMARSLEAIRGERARLRLPLDQAVDPNRTGIIGDEFTPLTTSLGEADAKRTSANPAFARVVTFYLQAAGVGRGDVVAVGASGSFPGFVLATLCAARALELEPVIIYSIGSSMYGANLPGFTFVDMLARLRADGVLPYAIAAVSPGGDQDGGAGVLFDEDGETLVAEARRSGLPMVEGGTLAARIQWRLRAYETAARGRPIRAFVNIGGASASFGDTPASLEVPNGLVSKWPAMPVSPTRGLIFEFAARGVPVIHLLHVRGLARDNGLPYDPVPLPMAAAKAPAEAGAYE